MKKRLCSLLLALSLLLCLAPSAGAVSTSASGAIVVDYQTGEVYFEKNADVARPAASMTKVMSCYLVFEEMAAGRLSTETFVPASSYAAYISNNPAFSGMEGLRAGHTYKVDTLLRLILTESCNGSVIALAEYIGGGSEAPFVARMNEKAAEWGIDAHFADCCGFIDNGNAVTPRAMAYIAKRIITDYPQILDYSSLRSTTFQGKTFYSTNSLLRNGTCEGIDGLKTGTTSGAGYCFTGTASRDGRRIISVVMGAGSYAARMSESRKLLEYGFTCRGEREAQWAAAEAGMTLDIRPEGGTVWPFTEVQLTATVSGLASPIPCDLAWEVNGKVIEGSAQAFTLENGASSSVACVLSGVEGALNAAVLLTLPDGRVVRREAAVPVAAEPLTFSGHLDFARLDLYPGAAVDIPLTVRCDQGVSCALPAGWYLDGAPIEHYQNPAFSLSPDGGSSYRFAADEGLAPGEHTLEFRCNPQGLPGAEQKSFSVAIHLLSGAQAAPAA